jgi:hypothetical protein
MHFYHLPVCAQLDTQTGMPHITRHSRAPCIFKLFFGHSNTFLALKIVLGGEVLYSIDRKLGRMKVIRLKERDLSEKKREKEKRKE